MRIEETKTEEKEVIEITEDVRVPGTDVILEAGDKIEILKENYVSSFGLAEKIAVWIAENLSMGQEMQSIVFDLMDDTKALVAKEARNYSDRPAGEFIDSLKAYVRNM